MNEFENTAARKPQAAEPFDPFGPFDPAVSGDCSAMVARLYNFLDGELTEQRRDKIQNHLEACPSCFSAFDFEAELRIVIASRCVSRVPDALAERIRNAICQAQASSPGA